MQCNRTLSLDALHSQILHEPRKLAVVGSGCSVATEAGAEVSHYYNITQVRRNIVSYCHGNGSHLGVQVPISWIHFGLQDGCYYRVSAFSGLECWTGVLEWSTGMESLEWSEALEWACDHLWESFD